MIFNILNKLSSTSSRLAKEAILNEEKDNTLLQKVFKAANDPTINFWIKKIPSYKPASSGKSLDWAIDQLEALTSRKVTGSEGVEHLTKVLSSVSADDAKVIERVIDRDLDCGVHTSTVNKVWKKLIPEFSYMRCLSGDWVISTDIGDMTISTIVENKIGCSVKSYDFTEHREVFSKVEDYFYNGTTDEWLVLEYIDDNGETVTSLPVTKEHIFFLEDGTEVPAGYIVPGDCLF